MSASTPLTATSARQLQHIAPTKQQELLRLVRSLSDACRADRNVLKNAQLVDVLESQARAILQSRREKKKQQRRQSQSPVAQVASTAAASTATTATRMMNNAPTLSPQRNKLIQKLAAAAAADDKSSSTSKRRKLSFESVTSPYKMTEAMPTAKHHAFAAAASAAVYNHASPLTVFAASVVDSNNNNNSNASLFTKAFKSLDHASLTTTYNNNSSIDLSASMASTVASAYYDDDDDIQQRYYRSNASTPTSNNSVMDDSLRRCDTPQSERTQLSIDSIDWSPSDDEDEEVDEACSAFVAVQAAAAPTTGASMRVSHATAHSTEAVMHVLFELLQQDAKYEWLVDPVNQQRVAALVATHTSKETQTQSDTSNVATATEWQQQIDALVVENARLVAANEQSTSDVEAQQQQVLALVAQLEAATAAAAATSEADKVDEAEAATRHRVVIAAADATTSTTSTVTTALDNDGDDSTQSPHEAMRRAAEASFLEQLRVARASVAALERAAAAKDADIAQLMAHVTALSAGSSSSDAATTATMLQHLRDVNTAREAEVQRLRSVVATKDRELCALHMQLTTKKTLVDAVAERLAHALTSFVGNSTSSNDVTGEAAAAALAAGRVTLDVDSFVFADALAKQQTIDELTAALGVMEREVETLEARAETLEGDNYRLKLTHDDVTQTLESANAELLRVAAENELMEASLADKQRRIRHLNLYLDEKEEQIMRLKDAAEQQMGLTGGVLAATTPAAAY